MALRLHHSHFSYAIQKGAPVKLVNTTGRYIIVSGEQGDVRDIIQPGEHRAHVEGESKEICGNPTICRFQDAQIVGLPEPEEDVYYIVTSDVAHLTDRDDIVIPEFHEGAMIDGRYVGVRRFLAINAATEPRPPGEEEDHRIF